MREKIVIAYRRTGLGDCLLQAANAWLYSKKSHRKLLIAWYHSLYLTDKHENAFFHYFEVPDTIDGVVVIKQKRLAPFVGVVLGVLRMRFRITKWKNKLSLAVHNDTHDAFNFSKNVHVMYGCFGPSDPVLKNFYDVLRLRKDLHQKVEAFAKRHFGDRSIIGVHVRYYPKHLPRSNHTELWLDESNALQSIEEKIMKCKRKFKEDCRIFLCTDSLMVQKWIKSTFEEVIMYNTILSKSSADAEIHLHDGALLAEESLIEMFLLAKCTGLIRYTNSWFSHYASLYVKEVL